MRGNREEKVKVQRKGLFVRKLEEGSNMNDGCILSVAASNRRFNIYQSGTLQFVSSISFIQYQYQFDLESVYCN